MAELSTLIAKYKRRLAYVQRESKRDVSHLMIDYSPVLSGSFVLSLTGTLNGVAYNDVSLPVPEDATTPWGLWRNPKEQSYKSTAKGNVNQSLVGMRVGDSYTFLSQKIYGPDLEYEASSYNKAPQGMRNRSIVQWRSIVDQHVLVASRGS